MLAMSTKATVAAVKVGMGPKLVMGLSGVVAAESAFSAHNLTVLIGPALAIILAFFSLRSMQTNIYKQNYEAQKDRAEEAERQRDAQRDAKHDIQNELAAANVLLDAERRKTDLTSVTSALKELEEQISELKPDRA